MFMASMRSIFRSADLKPDMTRNELLKAIQGHTLAYQSIVFVYQRNLPNDLQRNTADA